MEHKLSEMDLALLLLKAANNLNSAGFNDSVGKLLMQIATDLSKPIPQEDVAFLNEWCVRLEQVDLNKSPFGAFDLVSDLSQIMKRYVIIKAKVKKESGDQNVA